MYDSSSFLLRGEPATLQDGMEVVFPQILGAFHDGTTAGLIFALMNHIAMRDDSGSGEVTSAIRTAAILLMPIHGMI
jgi:hypothetical protein